MSNDMVALTERESLPRYVKVASQLRAQMKHGEIKPGDRLPSFPEMKARQGVSQATMERAHAILEREGLIIRRRGVGTFVAPPKPVSESSSVLAEWTEPERIATGLIGFVTNLRPEGQEMGRHAFWTLLLRGMTAAAQQAGKNLVLVHDLDEADESDIYEKLDAVLTTSIDSDIVRQIRRRMRPGTAWVSMLAQLEDVVSASADENSGIRMAVQHLLSLGHRRIAYLVGRPNLISQSRLAAYQAALVEAGIEPQLRWVRHMRLKTIEGEFVSAPRERMTEWLREDWRALGCTALLAHNDQAALGAIEVLRAAGLRVPEDVSVVGFDGVDSFADPLPQLTTIEVPLQEIGRCGIELSLRQLAGESDIASIVLPVRLVVGQSTAPVRNE